MENQTQMKEKAKMDHRNYLFVEAEQWRSLSENDQNEWNKKARFSYERHNS
jgi:hypothetical protein